MPKFKSDFHTHSILSYDGGINLAEYEEILNKRLLDYVAITDHNEIDFALEANKKLGDRVIVGEEIKTKDGEIIGLFLKKRIEPYLTAQETIDEIIAQKGIVYIPHPNIPFISSVKVDTLEQIADRVDMIEFFNAKNFLTQMIRSNSMIAQRLGRLKVAGSDSHSFLEVGKTYNILNEKITRDNLLNLLKNAEFSLSYINPLHLIKPKFNRILKTINDQ